MAPLAQLPLLLHTCVYFLKTVGTQVDKPCRLPRVLGDVEQKAGRQPEAPSE